MLFRSRALDRSIPSDIYNLGTKTGYSNMEVLNRAAQITQKDIPILFGPKREGDPAMLTADADKFTQIAAWQPQYKLDDIISHAWTWYNQ